MRPSAIVHLADRPRDAGIDAIPEAGLRARAKRPAAQHLVEDLVLEEPSVLGGDVRKEWR